MVVALLCLAVILLMFLLRLWYRNKTPSANDNNFTSSMISQHTLSRTSQFSHTWSWASRSTSTTQRAQTPSDRTMVDASSWRPNNSLA
jgi:type IV secretory pathway VirB3-like protein